MQGIGQPQGPRRPRQQNCDIPFVRAPSHRVRVHLWDHGAAAEISNFVVLQDEFFWSVVGPFFKRHDLEPRLGQLSCDDAAGGAESNHDNVNPLAHLTPSVVRPRQSRARA